MKRVILLVVAFLLSIGLIATLNDGEYIGLTGLLDSVSSVDFSFSETLNTLTDTFEQFERIFDGGVVEGENDFFEKVVLFFESLWSLITIPFVAVHEFILLLRSIFDLLFTLVGVF